MACRLRLWSYVDDFALVPETRVMKRGLTTPRTAYWNCPRSRMQPSITTIHARGGNWLGRFVVPLRAGRHFLVHGELTPR